jgi:hypothetical protein
MQKVDEAIARFNALADAHSQATSATSKSTAPKPHDG